MNWTEPTSAPAFVHNLDTCVGCHACVLACANENRLAPGKSWRQIVTFNAAHVQDLPVYHLSLACNHCLDAPCMKGCPSIAIRRDSRTGAVLIDNAKCIGCRYCSWVCPYDAPQFNREQGVMEKCTFCHHRLKENLQPACTTLCPTGALTFGQYDGQPGQKVYGFPEMPIRPALTILPLKGRAPQPAPPGAALPAEIDVASFSAQSSIPLPPSKISLVSEWSLAAFSFIGIALVAWFLASLAGGNRVHPEWFAGAGLTGLLLSTMHLGRKLRAWRALLNIQRSWLSREVLTYPLFLVLGVISSVVLPADSSLSWSAAVVGTLLLISFDAVYAVMAREWSAAFDGQSAVLSAAFLVSLLTGNVTMAVVTVLPRAYTVADRFQKRAGRGGVETWIGVMMGARILLGFLLPAILWLVDGSATMSVVVCAMAGEFLDRLDFYASLDIVTPRRSMARALM